jgi:hypothetical protein
VLNIEMKMGPQISHVATSAIHALLPGSAKN